MSKVDPTRIDLFREIDKLREVCTYLKQSIVILEVDLQALRRHIKYFHPEKDNKRLEKRGRFRVGEEVTWSNRGITHKGTIILVVEPKNYPDIQFRQSGLEKEYNVRTRGYYRYEESYIIEDGEGQQWWPRVGWLRRI